MNRTTAYMSEAHSKSWSIARPHAPDLERENLRRLELEKIDATMQSAGGMVMSANDALLWLELLINNGQLGGQQIIPPEVVIETRQRLAKVDQQFGPYHREDYGLGWYINAYKGDLMIHHFGGFSGFRAHVSYLPERRVGVVIFSNTAVIGSVFVDTIANYIYDLLGERRYSEQQRTELINTLKERYQNGLKNALKDRDNRALRQWQLSLPSESYTGTFSNPLFGTLEIRQENDALIAQLGVMHSKLEPYTAVNSARAELIPLRGTVLQFAVESRSVTSVALFGEVFLRVD